MNNSPFLSKGEIDEICAPLTQPAAQCRFIKHEFKVQVRRAPHNGRPLVLREALSGLDLKASERAKKTSAERPAVKPDASGLILAFGRAGR